MTRGQFHLFACRSGEQYAQKLVLQLKDLVSHRSQELSAKKDLTLHEMSELRFIANMHEEDIRVGKASVMHFDDGEMNVLLDDAENVRDKDVFLVQCAYNTQNELSISENLLETFLFLDVLRRSKARTISLVSLYYPYGRGDKQHGKDGVPAKMLATLLTSAGMDNIITMDLHADQITGFFNAKDVRVEHLHANALLIHYFKDRLGADACFAAPDAGAAKRVQFFARNLEKKMVLAYKKRSYEHKHHVEELKILGLTGKDEVIIIDDIVSSGGSVMVLMDKLSERGVKDVFVACAHPLLTGKAIERFDKAYHDKKHPFAGLIGTDAIPHNGEIKGKEWYTEICTARYVAKAVYEVHTSGSLTPLHKPFCVEKLGLWVEPGK